jgi:hypothetical protein
MWLFHSPLVAGGRAMLCCIVGEDDCAAFRDL